MHDIVQGKAGRRSDDEITVFKNGCGAHLDGVMAYAVYGALRGGEVRWEFAARVVMPINC